MSLCDPWEGNWQLLVGWSSFLFGRVVKEGFGPWHAWQLPQVHLSGGPSKVVGCLACMHVIIFYGKSLFVTRLIFSLTHCYNHHFELWTTA